MNEQNPDITTLLSPPDIRNSHKILCIQPHPDDNEIGMGGIVAVLAQRGCHISYLTVTNGDQGNLDITASPEQTAKIRHEEAINAGKYLGAEAFYFLEHGDGTLQDVLSLSKEIAKIIRIVRPDAIFAPDPWLPYESHLDHVVTGRAAANAFLMSGRAHLEEAEDLEPFSAKAIGYYFTSSPNVVIDISSVFDKKFEAMALHKSQLDDSTLQLYRIWFSMKGRELAQGRGFELGEGVKVLSSLHAHCFTDTDRIR